MQACKTLGMRHAGSQSRDGQRRSVASDHGLGAQVFTQLGKQCPLGISIFNNRFNHQITRRQVLQSVRRVKARQELRQLAGGDAVFGKHFLPLAFNGDLGLLGTFKRSVKQHDLATRLGGQLRNALAHGAGAANTDSGKE